MNLYNDVDPKVCEWTRELIADNQIPAGEVVCQSITDITHDHHPPADRERAARRHVADASPAI